jgi:ABC-type lipoprotein export system ATPase subunit
MSGLVVRCEQLRRIYEVDGPDSTRTEVVALDDISFELPAGSATAIVGPSGSGKSTLMTILAGLQRPTSGRVFVGDTDLASLSESGLLELRARSLAVVVQNPNRNLIPYGTADDNLRFAQRGPQSYRRQNLPDRTELLEHFGLGALKDVRVDRFSGGERQRLALATGLATGPDVLLADEPTSQLDETNRDAIVDLLKMINTDFGVTIVAVTHDPYVAERLGHSIALREGRISERTPQ